jgi:ADP-ribose pyrophosphatase YjhB (NUDIX family)
MQLRRYTIVRLILEDGDKVFLIQQSHRNGGKYTLVGGKVQLQESPIQALIRETQEECGAIVDEKDLHFVQYLYQRKATMINMVLVFRTTIWKGVVRNLEPHKFQAMGWFSKDALPDRTTKSTRHILNNMNKPFNYAEMMPNKGTIKK